jgi:hypothetical protein
MVKDEAIFVCLLKIQHSSKITLAGMAIDNVAHQQLGNLTTEDQESGERRRQLDDI